jgi:hypothetical protein
MIELTTEQRDLLMNEVVGGLEDKLTRLGFNIGSGADASRVVHKIWFDLIAHSIIERNLGRELY